MSRRGLVLSLLAGVVLSLLVLGPASAQTSRYGGILVVGIGGDPGSLDPTVANGGPSMTVIHAMCLRLYEYAWNHGALEAADPILAAATPEVSADKLSYTILLRRGVLFNDGTPFNAQAVVATYQRYITYPGSLFASDFANVDSVGAAGPYTVVYHLKQRQATFLGNMYVLSPAALATEGANFAANPVCVSPFMFDHRVVGDNVTLVKSPYYFKRGAVHLDKIVFVPATDGPAAVAALQAGDMQVITNVDPALLPAVRDNHGLRVLSAPWFVTFGLRINVGNKNGVGSPYANVGTPLAQSAKLRQAFEEAIDRTTMNRVVFGGFQRPSCTPIAPADIQWYAVTKMPCTPYDPNDARKLVAASGFPTPITVHLLTDTRTSLLRLAQFIQAEEAAVGFNVVIDPVANVTTSIALALGGHFDTVLIGNINDPDPNNLIYNILDSGGAMNVSGYSNARLDYVLANGLKATSFSARAANYRVAQQIIHDDRPIIVLYNSVPYIAFDASVLTGLQRAATGSVELANVQYK